MAFRRVDVIDNCPTTVSKLAGLYFLAETIKLSISKLQAKAHLPKPGRLIRRLSAISLNYCSSVKLVRFYCIRKPLLTFPLRFFYFNLWFRFFPDRFSLPIPRSHQPNGYYTNSPVPRQHGLSILRVSKINWFRYYRELPLPSRWE